MMVELAPESEAPASVDVVEARCLRIASSLSLVAVGIGLCVLVGWTAGLPALTTLLPGLVSMKPNTAIGICLGGVGLFLLARPAPTPTVRRGAALFGGFMALLGALTAAEYLGGFRFGIDELFFKDLTFSGAPGRMAPITTANFLCIGTSLLLLGPARRTVFAHALAAVTVFTSTLAIVGYVYGVGPLYQAGRFTAVALHTSVAFLLLSVGVWCAGSRAGFMRIVTNSDTSGRLVRRCAPAAAVLPFLIGWLRVQGVRLGWFGPELGVVIVAMSNAMAFVVLVWIGARFVRVSEQRQREAQERFREIGNAMPQIVWAAGADRQIDYYNERWYEYTGVARDAFGDVSWQHVLPPEDLARVASTWASAAAAGHGFEVESRVRRASDGEFRWFLSRALPIKDAHGTVLRWIGTATDIHERKLLREQNVRLLESERTARAEAERTSRMKDEFLSTLSHELRTPLNAILGWTQVLRGEPANSPDQESGLATIERNARAQKGIVDDLLDMSSIISGKVRLDVQWVDLAAVLQSSVESVRPAADAKGIRLHSAIDTQSPEIRGDSNRLQQVCWNLLTNAVKFTPSGGRVQIALAHVDSRLEISVSDTGEGIPIEFLPHVFDRFRQADASSTRRHGGLGLGLAIVKQLVELHGGSIQVHSAGLGQGASFRVAIPLVSNPYDINLWADGLPHPSAAASPVPMHAPSRQLAGVRVVVVDDEADARMLVKRLLEDRGARVRTAGSTAEAMTLLRTETPHVLVSDIGMPDEDGYALIRQVRTLSAQDGGQVPAVALTAYARAEDRIKAVLAGYQMHVAKPVEPGELQTIVAKLAEQTMLVEAASALARDARASLVVDFSL